MALIDCPSCSQRISSKASVCSHCSFVIAELSEEQRVAHQRISKIEKSQKIMNQSMVAMLLFCGGFGSMFWGQPEPGSIQYSLGMGTSVVGFIWYIVNRVRIIMLKKK